MEETQTATVQAVAPAPISTSLRTSPEIGKLCAALAQAQIEIKGAEKDSFNPHFGNPYADLASVWDACHGPLNSRGIAIIQAPVNAVATLSEVTVITLLVHGESGQWIESTLVMPVLQKTAQAVGSAITYGRRYSLSAMSGVAPRDDDDGNAASGNQQSRPAATAKRAEPKPTKQQEEAAPATEKPHVTALPAAIVLRMKDPSSCMAEIDALANELSELVGPEKTKAGITKALKDIGAESIGSLSSSTQAMKLAQVLYAGIIKNAPKPAEAKPAPAAAKDGGSWQL